MIDERQTTIEAVSIYSEMEELIKLLGEVEGGRLDTQGGYPSVISDEIPGYILIAGADHDEAPTLEVKETLGLIDRFRAAKALLAEWRAAGTDGNLVEAWYETDEVDTSQAQISRLDSLVCNWDGEVEAIRNDIGEPVRLVFAGRELIMGALAREYEALRKREKTLARLEQYAILRFGEEGER